MLRNDQKVKTLQEYLFPSLAVDKSPESGVDPEDSKDDEEAEKGLATNEFSMLLPFYLFTHFLNLHYQFLLTEIKAK